jgi:uncharacterized protein (DUF488 family)
MTEAASTELGGLLGVGYEGRTVQQLVAHLVAAGVSRLVDVRLTPISRKPGLSKTALGRALAEAGIEYEHRRELGNPKGNRAGFAGSAAAVAEARAVFTVLLHRPESHDAVEELAAAAWRERVALLCFEADQHRCHRDVILHEARRRAAIARVSASRRQAR